MQEALQNVIKQETEKMTEEEKIDFMRSILNKYKQSVEEKKMGGRLKRRTPLNRVRAKNRKKNRLASQSRSKNRNK